MNRTSCNQLVLSNQREICIWQAITNCTTIAVTNNGKCKCVGSFHFMLLTWWKHLLLSQGDSSLCHRHFTNNTVCTMYSLHSHLANTTARPDSTSPYWVHSHSGRVPAGPCNGQYFITCFHCLGGDITDFTIVHNVLHKSQTLSSFPPIVALNLCALYQWNHFHHMLTVSYSDTSAARYIGYSNKNVWCKEHFVETVKRAIHHMITWAAIVQAFQMHLAPPLATAPPLFKDSTAILRAHSSTPSATVNIAPLFQPFDNTHRRINPSC